ncbi:hypothetical protein AYI68_g5342 [Smittium mucronatum]|uniref:Uncharacterized protein n=1 Tax=Smittium mucronatum TaxID=133383 RepID=A0A1R0GUJ2_9FUNG|nr:hypothetical protein AYI68_g5342 [Smittium mucronatum]
MNEEKSIWFWILFLITEKNFATFMEVSTKFSVMLLTSVSESSRSAKGNQKLKLQISLNISPSLGDENFFARDSGPPDIIICFFEPTKLPRIAQ